MDRFGSSRSDGCQIECPEHFFIFVARHLFHRFHLRCRRKTCVEILQQTYRKAFGDVEDQRLFGCPRFELVSRLLFNGKPTNAAPRSAFVGCPIHFLAVINGEGVHVRIAFNTWIFFFFFISSPRLKSRFGMPFFFFHCNSSREHFLFMQPQR